MSEQELTYRQVMGENGEIKYVPTNPPPPPEKKPQPGDNASDEKHYDDEKYNETMLKYALRAMERADFTQDEQLTEVMKQLAENAKRLRYNKRLTSGKLDSNRLTAYRTSDRLFKKKAIKDKHYQFTFLIDNSGSMLSDEHGDDGETTPMQVAAEAVVRTTKTLKDIGVKSSIFSMNCAFDLLKGFDDPLDEAQFRTQLAEAMGEKYNSEGDDSEGAYLDSCKAYGTSEWIAYEQTMEYLARNSSPKTTNVVIVLSDGEPGSRGDFTPVTMEDGVTRLIAIDDDKNGTDRLASFWNSRPDVLAYGIGIHRKAKQVPNNKKINNVKELPNAMGDLLTELMI